MEFKDKKLWEEGLQNNQDIYGKACYNYAMDWANTMEELMKQGKELEDIAKETSFQVSEKHGITGFMYGMAVSILSSTWKYGEQLRQWHNLDIQIGNEGEKANKKGTVLNPAIIKLHDKEE